MKQGPPRLFFSVVIMPEAVAAAGAAQNAQNGQQRQGGGLLSGILRMAMMWYMMQWFKGGNQGQSGQSGPVSVAHPLYHKGDLINIRLYLSEDEFLHDRTAARLLWEQKDVGLATTEERLLETTYKPSKVSSLHQSCEFCCVCASSTRRRVHAGAAKQWHSVCARLLFTR